MAKRHLKCHPATMVVDDNDDTEQLPQCRRVLDQYFVKAHAHQEVRSLERGHCYFYCFDYLGILPSVPARTVSIPLSRVPSPMFFDIYSHNRNQVTFPATSDVWNLVVEGSNTIIGKILFPDRILLASDWTHSENDVTLVTEVFAFLEERGILRKIVNEEAPTPRVSVTLGCDPEFEHLISPLTYEPVRTFMGSNHTINEGNCGVDGAGDQVEIRPKPSESPETLVNRIGVLIRRLPPVSTRGDRYPLGGHMHFGIPSHPQLITGLDDFIGRPSLKTSGRARGSYGAINQYRTQPHGFEYRTPASSWLENPRIAKITLKLAKGIVESILSEGLEYEVSDSTQIPNAESYLKFLSEGEYKYFYEFHHNYQAPKGAINAFWMTTKGETVAATIELHFSDDWSERIKTKIRTMVSKIKPKSYQIITLFGLAESRGKVLYNLVADGYETITTQPEVDAWADRIGLPYEFRSEGVDETHLMRALEAKLHLMASR